MGFAVDAKDSSSGPVTYDNALKVLADYVGINDRKSEIAGRTIADQLGLPRYDQDDDAHHSYGHVTTLCSLAAKGCDIDYAAEGLRHGAAPGQGSPAVPGEVREQTLIGGNKIMQFADGTRPIVVNMTESNHWLRDGFVIRWVVAEHGQLNIRTYGEGKNLSWERAVVNQFGGHIFKYSDINIQQQMELRIRETPQ